ncbi:MAG: Ig-like domain-containing protein [bacterium]|nr:Ig-like domain-containing protein [bacterium]
MTLRPRVYPLLILLGLVLLLIVSSALFQGNNLAVAEEMLAPDVATAATEALAVAPAWITGAVSGVIPPGVSATTTPNYCSIARLKTDDSLPAGLSYRKGNIAYRVGSYAVTSCIDMDFGSVRSFSSLRVDYWMPNSICGNSCTGNYCGTNPGGYILVSRDKATWTLLGSLPYSTIERTVNYAKVSTMPLRYARVCRAGAAASFVRGGIAVDFLAGNTVFPDTTPPSVSLYTPANNQIISGAIVLSATASDEKGVAGVQFKVDNASVGDRDTTIPYSASWDTTRVADGPHTVVAIATDASGNIKVSAARTANVLNTQAPCILNGVEILSGQSATFYSTSIVAPPALCSSYVQTRTCTNGVLSGELQYRFAQCTVAAAQEYTPRPIITDALSQLTLMWGRHSPKYVRVGHYRYAVLQNDLTTLPIPAAIYRFDENAPGSGWQLAWMQPSKDAHQPPSLILDNNGALNILYDDANGKLAHLKFTGASTGTLSSPQIINTSPFNSLLGNFYFAYHGVAYAVDSDTIYFCATDHISDIFRCGAYRSGAWSQAYEISKEVGGRLLYPNLYASGDKLRIASGLHMDQADYDIRQLNRFILVSGYGSHVDSKATLGNISNSTQFFEEDIDFDGQHTLYLLGTALATNANYLFVIDTATGFRKKIWLPIAGFGAQTNEAGHNLIVHGARIDVIGNGQHAVSIDAGTTWSVSPYTIAGYPLNDYAYVRTHIMKTKSGAALPDDRILLLENVRNLTTGRQAILEVEMPLGDVLSTASESASDRSEPKDSLASASSPGLVERFFVWLANLIMNIRHT